MTLDANHCLPIIRQQGRRLDGRFCLAFRQHTAGRVQGLPSYAPTQPHESCERALHRNGPFGTWQDFGASQPPAMLDTQTGELPPLPCLNADDPAIRSRATVPRKFILSDEDMGVWQTSDAHHTLLLFLMRLADACTGQPTRLVPWDRSAHNPSDGINRVLTLLIELDTWTDEIAPLAGPQRFGNLAFRTWGARLAERVEVLHEALLPSSYRDYIRELVPYLLDAFGSFVRIDYGTGHELHFVAWLGFLVRLGVLPATEETETRLALEVLPAYLRVTWHLQDRYALEPAGSHGVWGLDDFHFVPYILGAAQLRDSALSPAEISDAALYPFSKRREPRTGPKLSPSDTLAYQLPRTVSPQPNLYVSSLARIHSLKRGPFEEHSPILYDIARNVAAWPKVYKGMIKMYDAECLMKRPVVQHFVFGAVGYVWPEKAVPAPQPTAASPRTVLPAAMPMGRPDRSERARMGLPLRYPTYGS